MDKEKNTFTLVKGTHFVSAIALQNYLNDNFKKKLVSENKIYNGVQKVSFNLNDVHHYYIRGGIPKYLNGNNRLQKIFVPEFDLEIYELSWL